MVRQRAKAHKKAEDTSWVPKAIETIRDLVTQGETIDVVSFSAATELHDLDMAQQRLRYLTQLGWLHMSAERNIADDNSFVRYVWELR